VVSRSCIGKVKLLKNESKQAGGWVAMSRAGWLDRRTSWGCAATVTCHSEVTHSSLSRADYFANNLRLTVMSNRKMPNLTNYSQLTFSRLPRKFSSTALGNGAFWCVRLFHADLGFRVDGLNMMWGVAQPP